MSAATPTEYSWINGWAFSADSDYEYISGGAITDTTNDDLWANIFTLGTIVCRGADIRHPETAVRSPRGGVLITLTF
jgi:hypothetical protein